MARLWQITVTTGALVGLPSLAAQPIDLEAPGYPLVFEGVVTQSDAAVQPEAAEGLVLSGSLMLRKKADGTMAAKRGGTRYAKVADLGEVALDRFRVATYWMTQRTDVPAELEIVDRPAGETDVLELLLPLKGEALGSGYQAAWLYLWLEDPAGELVAGQEYIRATPTVEEGSFQLVFWSQEADDFVTVEGDLRFASPDFPTVSADQEIASLQNSLRQLGDILQQTEARLAERTQELEAAQKRIQGLNQTVDVLIQERSALQAEVNRLREQKATAPQEMLDKLAKLEAELGVEQLAREEATGRNVTLAESLARVESERHQARQALTELQATLDRQTAELKRLRELADAPRATQRDFSQVRETTPVVTPTRATPPQVVYTPPPRVEEKEAEDNTIDRRIRIGSRRR
ncbi:MAG: hypothetical protein Q7P63_03870 [Verrucomicrobiota bacterium JB022]|nr:hypothetical protein [Verrucomicrobiota bacterium JB022]